MKRRQTLPPGEEARRILAMLGGPDSLGKSMEFLRHHFNVIQARSQLLLTISTLALTITGFSGPKIAQTNAFARYSMAIGIGFVLAGMVFLLLGGLRIRWTTQFFEETPERTLIRIIEHRNSKTRFYFLQLTLLVIGLTAYVAAVITYLMNG
jgi:predicted lysophospholipase L1 biosynthesis ABC-type transport system permease subunit